jgi:hypothetical protein
MAGQESIPCQGFLKKAAAAAAGFTIAPRFVLGGREYTTPSDESLEPMSAVQREIDEAGNVFRLKRS